MEKEVEIFREIVFFGEKELEVYLHPFPLREGSWGMSIYLRPHQMGATRLYRLQQLSPPALVGKVLVGEEIETKEKVVAVRDGNEEFLVAVQYANGHFVARLKRWTPQGGTWSPPHLGG